MLPHCLWALGQDVTNVDRCYGDVSHLTSIEVRLEPSRHSGNAPFAWAILSDELVMPNHLERSRPP
eukprot:6483131-Amphidinium_carterae.3